MNIPNYLYDGAPLLDRGYFLNFCKGPRGVGKTFYFKAKTLIEKLKLNNGSKFLWIRRYKPELDDLFKKTFYTDILEEAETNEKGTFNREERKLLTGADFNLNKNAITFNKKEVGYYFPLVTASTKKSIPLKEVDKIIFDEYLIKKGSNYRYLKDEYIQFMEFVSSVVRMRDNVKIYCLGNNLSATDPYSLALKMPYTQKGFTTLQNPLNGTKNILLEVYNNEEFEKKMYKTQFGQIIQGTTYGDYAVSNKTLTEDNTFIETRPKNTMFRYAIRYEKNYYGFWLDTRNGILYASSKYDFTSKRIYALTRDDMSLNTYFITNKRFLQCPKEIVSMYSTGSMRFENEVVKEKVLEIISYLL